MNNEQLEHRILSRTVKTESCWFYTGAKMSGYGSLTINGKRRGVHRLYYEIVKGSIPEGLELDHLCMNKHCINPDHLQAVTHLENTRRGPQSKEDTFDKPPSKQKKTHLLYIHNDKFREEKNKSALVNQLLEAHYSEYDIVKHYTDKINKEVSEYKDKEFNLKGECRNGHIIGKFGKCLEKGCKYA